MKTMKKKLLGLILVASVASMSSAFAQAPTLTENATLNITLSSVLSFSVASPNVNVDFDTETKYTDGITAAVPNHIVVVSSRGYIVTAKAGTITGDATLDPATVKITTTIGTANTGNTSGITYASGTALPATGGTAAAVITALNSSWNASNSTNKFDVSYLIGANGVYANKALGANVIPVVYTVTQQ